MSTGHKHKKVSRRVLTIMVDGKRYQLTPLDRVAPRNSYTRKQVHNVR